MDLQRQDLPAVIAQPSPPAVEGDEPSAKRPGGLLPTGGLLRGRLERAIRYVPNLGLLALVILLWQFASTLWLPSIDPHITVLMPAPTSIAASAATMIVSGELLYHLTASLAREATAFVGASSAIPLGLAMGWWRPVYNQVNPIMEILRPIPPLTIGIIGLIIDAAILILSRRLLPWSLAMMK